MTLGGSAFHARAPATGNARSPSEDRRVAGTTTSVLEAELERLSVRTAKKKKKKKSIRMQCCNLNLLEFLR